MSRVALINPNAVLFLEKGLRAHGSESDLLAFAVELQRIAGTEMEFLAESLRDKNPSGAVESQLRGHRGNSMAHSAAFTWISFTTNPSPPRMTWLRGDTVKMSIRCRLASGLAEAARSR